MPVESASDILQFLDPDEFGVAATYTLAAGGTSNIQGIFDKEFNEILENQFGAGVSVHPARFGMREADLPGGYGDGDELIVAAKTYKVRAHEHDGTGMTSLRLQAA